MPEDMVLLHCAPTLAGIKTANMFSVPEEDPIEFRAAVVRLNRLLVPRGLRMIPLCKKGGKVLVYLYRPDRLGSDLSDEQAMQILSERNYPVENCHGCILNLIKRLEQEEGFPHEIGLFLGYPPEDVKGFIDNNARNEKLIGFWKVYGDVEKAKSKFEQYKKCTQVYCDHYRQCNSFERLIVAVT